MSAKISKEQQSNELLNRMIRELYQEEALLNTVDPVSDDEIIKKDIDKLSQEFSDIQKALNQFEMSPSDRVMDNVMNYARTFKRSN